MRYQGVVLVALVVAAAFCQSDAYAAKKKTKAKPKPKIIYVNPDQVFETDVKFKLGKKTLTSGVTCLDRTPGETKSSKKGLIFNSYSSIIKKLKKNTTAKGRKKLARYKQLNAAAGPACAKPDFLSLSRYTGRFGEAEATILFNRFAFSGKPADISKAVHDGLQNTVNSLTTPKSEPAGVTEIENDMRRVGHRWWEDGEEQTDQRPNLANPYDVYNDGTRYGVIRTMYHTANPFFYKMFMFLHDERLAASAAGLRWGYDLALIDYIELLRRAAFMQNFTYKDYMRAWNHSVLGNYLYLNGLDSKGTAPNENYAREFWELGTIGTTSLQGLISGQIDASTANYTDQDVAQAARAFSGVIEDCQELTFADGPDQGTQPDEQWVCGADYSSSYPSHAQGAKLLFQGTKYQQLVENQEDMLNAAFNDERTSQSLAYDLWNEFICRENISVNAVNELAKLIRDNDYNLLPVMRQLMMSKAVYANANRGCLIKHPLELLLGFLRSTGIPFEQYYNRPFSRMEDWLDNLGQVPLSPPTIFGWNEQKLAGEAYILDWRKVVIDIVNDDTQHQVPGENYKTDDGVFYRNQFLNGVGTASALVDRVAAVLGITVSAAEKETLARYVRYDYYNCEDYYWIQECRGGQPFYMEDIGEPLATREDSEAKVRGLVALMSMLPSYRLK